jgi:hypothetical protein
MTIKSTLAAVALLLAATSPATAAVYEIRYTGRVNFGFDQTGVFTTANTTLVGLPFDLRYTLTYPGVGIVDFNTPTDFALSGGRVVNAASPLSAVLTINGRTISLTGSQEARFQRGNLPNFEGFSEFVGDFSQVGNVVTSREVQTTFYGNSSNFLTSVDPAAGGLNFSLIGYRGTILNHFSVNDGISTPVPNQVPIFTPTRVASGSFFLENFSQQLVTTPPNGGGGGGGTGAVPEPASWAMLVMGFGLVGSLARRRAAGGTPVAV